MTEGSVIFEPAVSLEALATLGEGHIAYVKQIRSEDVPGLFPQAPQIALTLIPALGATSLAFSATVSAPTTDPNLDNNSASVTLENPTPLVARPAGGGFSCSLPRTPTGASPSSGGLWLLGLVTAALGRSRRRNSAS